jgi:hypothetical protein
MHLLPGLQAGRYSQHSSQPKFLQDPNPYFRLHVDHVSDTLYPRPHPSRTHIQANNITSSTNPHPHPHPPVVVILVNNNMAATHLLLDLRTCCFPSLSPYASSCSAKSWYVTAHVFPTVIKVTCHLVRPPPHSHTLSTQPLPLFLPFLLPCSTFLYDMTGSPCTITHITTHSRSSTTAPDSTAILRPAIREPGPAILSVFAVQWKEKGVVCMYFVLSSSVGDDDGLNFLFAFL